MRLEFYLLVSLVRRVRPCRRTKFITATEKVRSHIACQVEIMRGCTLPVIGTTPGVPPGGKGVPPGPVGGVGLIIPHNA